MSSFLLNSWGTTKMSHQHVQWPDYFVYVCPATKSATVRHKPLLDVPNNIAFVLVLRALANSNAPSETEYNNSVAPAEDLVSMARMRDIPCDVLTGPPFEMAPWVDAMYRAADIARELDAEIVLNVKGGTKETVLGALLAHDPATMPPLHILSVPIDGPQAKLGTPSEGPQMRSLPTSPPSQLSDFLERHRHLWARRADALPTRNWLLAPAQLAFAEEMANRPDLVRAMNTAELSRNRERNLTRWRGRHTSIDLDGEAAELARMYRLVESDGRKFFVRRKEHCYLMKGGWLEVLVYRSVRDALHERNIGAMVELSVDLVPKMANRRNTRATLGEIDVVVLAGDRLIPIECKSGESSKGFSHAIRAVATYRDDFSGPGGQAFFVAPQFGPEHTDTSDVEAKLRHSGVVGVFGRDCWKRVGPMVCDALSQG
ncbi:MAG: Card1-like endonuclease domain-containing protein [Shimia sp.]